jgi:hypothetical protein
MLDNEFFSSILQLNNRKCKLNICFKYNIMKKFPKTLISKVINIYLEALTDLGLLNDGEDKLQVCVFLNKCKS